ncbi:MAG: ABC transporter ATP-binding protein [Bacteroidetes bacterium]|nr:ABC transporter ATP-binding protein [Bacteroidota bacterium]
MPIIQIQNVNKVYDETKIPVHALSDINLKIDKGEYTAIVGPSGSGKTTLLNMIGGLDNPTSGKVIVNGIDLSSLKTDKLIEFRLRNIGFVFQSFNLIPVLTAKENVEFIMLLQGVKKEEREKRSIELLKAVGLEDKLDARPFELSGGQQQRVAVARALASNPSFVLADEPTANLDTDAAEGLLDIMETLNREREMTFIFATHDYRVINRARRVITLHDGKISSDTLQR